MTISDFTKKDLDRMRENCNFVGKEIELFEMRSNGYTLEYIAEKLDMSIDGVRKISRKVNKKIIRII